MNGHEVSTIKPACGTATAKCRTFMDSKPEKVAFEGTSSFRDVFETGKLARLNYSGLSWRVKPEAERNRQKVLTLTIEWRV
jgi:hypothetical protein